LKSIAQAIRESCRRATDFSARFGGEEFVVVLPATFYLEVKHHGERLCRAVETLGIPHRAVSAREFVTVSIGGATAIPGRGESVLFLVNLADRALYEAKRKGRNRVVTHDRASPDRVATAQGAFDSLHDQ